MVFENGVKNIQAAAYNFVYCFDNINQKKQSLRKNKHQQLNENRQKNN
jgi:hypothetical protein